MIDETDQLDETIVLQTIENYEKILNKANSVLKKISYLTLEEQRAECFSITEKSIYYKWEYTYRYCDTEYGEFYLPVEILWNEDKVVAELIAQYEHEKQLEIQKLENERKQQAQIKIEQEKQQLKDLLKKYGDEIKL